MLGTWVPSGVLAWLAGLIGGCILAAAQTVADAPGVTVTLNGSTVLHRTGVIYPLALRQKGVQGTVLVEVTLDAKGNVSDARVLSGPAELRRTSLESVLSWHFTEDAANSSRQVGLRFELPGEATRAERGSDFNPALVVLPPAPAGPLGRRIQMIEVREISNDARNALLARLPAREGEVLSQELAEATVQAVKDFDEHLRVGFAGAPNGESAIEIALAGYRSDPSPSLPSVVNRIRIGSSLLQSKLKSAQPPGYPALARQARVEGVVKLNAVVGKDGSVQNLSVVSGHPLLIPAAIEAVKHWTYEPTAINGSPTDVESEVDVNFALPPP